MLYIDTLCSSFDLHFALCVSVQCILFGRFIFSFLTHSLLFNSFHLITQIHFYFLFIQFSNIVFIARMNTNFTYLPVCSNSNSSIYLNAIYTGSVFGFASISFASHSMSHEMNKKKCGICMSGRVNERKKNILNETGCVYVCLWEYVELIQYCNELIAVMAATATATTIIKNYIGDLCTLHIKKQTQLNHHFHSMSRFDFNNILSMSKNSLLPFLFLSLWAGF